MRSHSASLLLAGFILCPAAAGAPCGWQSVGSGSELGFTARYAGQAMAGVFANFQVSVRCADDGHPGALAVNVATDSADMQDDEANAELREPDWFDVANFPRAQYRSEAIRAVGEGYVASGSLSLKGLQRALDIPFDWQVDGDRAVLSGAVELSRGAWRVGGGEWAADPDLADAVIVQYRVQLEPVD